MPTGAVHGAQVRHALHAALASHGPVMTSNPAQMLARNGVALTAREAARPVQHRNHGTAIPKTFALEPVPTGAGLTAALIPARSVQQVSHGTAKTLLYAAKQKATGVSLSGKAVLAGVLTMNALYRMFMQCAAMLCASQTLEKAS